MDTLESLKIILREKDVPFFDDEELAFYMEQNGGDLRATARQCLIIKSENTTLQISGLSAGDTSKYFLRLAAQYRPNHSGVLLGG